MQKLAILLMSLSLVACGAIDTLSDTVNGAADYFFGEDNSEPPVELTEYTAEVNPDLLWKETIGEGPGEKYLKLRPGVTDSLVIVADHNGLVQALNRHNGDLKWEAETKLALSAGPGISDKLAVFASSHGEVIALNPESGATLWKAKISSEVLSNPVIAQGIVVVRSIDGRVLGFSETDGHKVWDFDRSVPVLSLRGTGTPVVEDDMLIGGFDNGKLLALRLKDGKQVWEESIAIPQGRSEVERIVDLDVDPLLKKGVIFIAGYHGGVSAALTRNGEVLWRNDTISSYAGMSQDESYLYLTDSASDVWQLDQRNGASLWKQKDLHQRKLTAAIVYENYVVVGDFEGYVHWLSVHDGRQLGRINIASEAIDVAPVVKDDIVYVYAKDGTLAALKARSL